MADRSDNTLDIYGSHQRPTYTVTSATTAVAGRRYSVNTTSGSVTMTLPVLATTDDGAEFWFYKTAAANSMVIDGAGAETIEGNANVTVTGQYTMVQVRKAGSVWQLVKVTSNPGGIDSAQIADGSVDPVHLAAVSVAPAANAACALLNTTTEVLLTISDATNTAISTTSSVAGQRVMLRVAAAAGGGSYTLAVTTGTLTLNSVGETAFIQRNVANSAWFAVALTAGDAGGDAATIV